jgi:hypothetical protein
MPKIAGFSKSYVTTTLGKGRTLSLFMETRSEHKAKLARMRSEFGSYIEAHAAFTANYGNRRRNGETISTAFAESAVNHVFSKRCVKKQQMRWTRVPRPLQIRTRVLTDEWPPTGGTLESRHEDRALSLSRFVPVSNYDCGE